MKKTTVNKINQCLRYAMLKCQRENVCGVAGLCHIWLEKGASLQHPDALFING